MGVDRILLASQPSGTSIELDIFVVVAENTRRSEARRLVSDLRQSGIRVDMSDEERSVKAQFKESDRRGAAHAVVVGDEWSHGDVTIKDLHTGEQRQIQVKEIETWLRG
jgi:histidyl-tRNA synthetase